MSKKGIILFVDDEFYLLSTLKAIVKSRFRGYQIFFAEGAEEALELLDSFKSIEKLLVFSDWHMPVMKGDELLIKIHRKYPHSINYLLSGMITKNPDKEAFESGAIQRVLRKPWINDELLKIIEDSLSDDFKK